MVSRFLAPGLPIGAGATDRAAGAGSRAPIELIAALLCYALACELYIFLYTMVSSSVTVSLLLRLRHGPADWQQLDADYSDETMVDGRLTKLVANGLIVLDPRGLPAHRPRRGAGHELRSAAPLLPPRWAGGWRARPPTV